LRQREFALPILPSLSGLGHAKRADRTTGRIKPLAGETYTLHDLAARVKERAGASAEISYTRKLLDKGVAHCAKKLGEEAVETALAAVVEDRERLIAEAADLLYHLLVVLEARDVALTEVEAALARRTGMSGLEEKAARPRA
jgi:phosphoribosyl-ATP pyrophosphohydrolase